MNSSFIETLFPKREEGKLFYGQQLPEGGLVESDNPFFIEPHYVKLNMYKADAKSTHLDEVAEYRNILIEFDEGSLDDQWDAITKIELMYTSRVFSGNKSDHFIISLEDPVDLETYRFIAQWIYNIVEKRSGLKPDPSCKTPAKFTRYPGVCHPVTEARQELLEVNSRVSNERLAEWLRRYEQYKPYVYKAPLYSDPLTGDLRGRSKDFFKDPMVYWQSQGGQRHDLLKMALFDMLDAQFTKEQMEVSLREAQTKLGIEDDRVEGLIEWAFKNELDKKFAESK